jgi:hypothetical protein
MSFATAHLPLLRIRLWLFYLPGKLDCFIYNYKQTWAVRDVFASKVYLSKAFALIKMNFIKSLIVLMPAED